MLPHVLEVTGGIPLSGSVPIGGAKNSALPIMAASILAEGTVRLEHIPDVTDVRILRQVLRQLGISVVVPRQGVLLIETQDPSPFRADYGLVRRMRASFCVLGPLIARRGRAVVALPGGCRIGTRPVDIHLAGLAALGADICVEHGFVKARAHQLRGCKIQLTGPRGSTVTGTANVLSAAVLARGETIITGAAVEPEVVDLANFLIAMGARIEGQGSPKIVVQGVDHLQGSVHRIIPDRIEGATLLTAAAISRGRVTISRVVPEHLSAVLSVLQDAGAEINVSSTSITISAQRRLHGVHVTALPYPGLPSDIQSPLTTLLSVTSGTSVVCDRVFPDRFIHIDELTRMGADIRRYPSGVVVRGVRRLLGADVQACDLRGGAALVLAGLVAHGQTRVRGAYHLDRGYERLDQKLGQLGAVIQRVSRVRPRYSLFSTRKTRSDANGAVTRIIQA